MVASGLSRPYAFLAITLALLGTSCSRQDQEIRATTQGLELHGSLHDLQIPWDSLDLGSMRVVKLASEEDYRPRRRLWGVGQPGIETERFQLEEYLEGWFLLGNGEIAFVLSSDHREAVYIHTSMVPPDHVSMISRIGRDPSSTTFALLLGRTDPDELVERITSSYASSGELE